MNKQTQLTRDDTGQLAEDARTLLAATSDGAGEKVREARQRLTAALDRGKEIYGQLREKTVAGARATDEAVHKHPYQAIALGVGAGALIGYLGARRTATHRE